MEVVPEVLPPFLCNTVCAQLNLTENDDFTFLSNGLSKQQQKAPVAFSKSFNLLNVASVILYLYNVDE